MRFKQFSKALRTSIKLSVSLCLSLPSSLLAGNRPQNQDLITLNADLNARSSSHFLRTNNNIVTVLKKGSRAEIIERKYFPKTGNYGLCLKTFSQTPIAQNQSDCLWVYYRSNAPAMKLYSVASHPTQRAALLARWTQQSDADKGSRSRSAAIRATKNPAHADAAQTTEPVSAQVIASDHLQESQLQSAQPALSAQASIAQTSRSTVPADVTTPDAQTVASQIAQQLDFANHSLAAITSSEQIASTCKDCRTEMVSYPRCQRGNSYLIEDLLKLSKDPNLGFLFGNNQPEMIRASCIQRSMDQYPSSSSFYRDCTGNKSHHVEKACTEKNYVEMTANSFNLVARCMSPEITGSQDSYSNKKMALKIFELLNHESGFHINAVSYSNAAGAGQLTDDGISGANKLLPFVRNRLQQSSDPGCQQIADILKKPLKASRSAFCDRISAEDGNPLKGIAYAFLYQYTTRDFLNTTVFNSTLFRYASQNLSEEELTTLKNSIQIWAHNTGPAGMKTPLINLLAKYARAQKKITDTRLFLKELAGNMRSHPARGNRHRRRETSTFYAKILTDLTRVTQERESCIAQ